MTASRKWVALTAVAVLLMLVAGWMLLVQPSRARAAELREQTTAQESANETAQLGIARLERQAKTLEEVKARLKELQGQIPSGPEPRALIDGLADVARSSNVTLRDFSPQAPTPLIQPTPTSGATTAPETSGTDAGGAPTQAAPPELFSIPLALTVGGTFGELEKLLGKLENFNRAFLVTGVTVSVDESGAAAEATEPGSGQILTMAVTGQVFATSPTTAVVTSSPELTGTTS